MSKKIQKIYVCGPTVYNHIHIGNLRPILTFDLILKGYREQNIPFKFIHNITDIDDKIINKAIEENKSEKEISEFYTEKYLNLLKDLNIDTITQIEKVTDNINFIESYITKIINANSAYKDENNNVWFDISRNQKNYGTVSKQNIDKMIFDELSYGKKFKGDFALWKNTTLGIKYKTSLGLGRPGWHTECCALIDKHFGKNGVNIHGGGMDLIFPHHENENIQHFSIYNKNLADKWLRTGQINLDGIKMSKSLGNIILASSFIEKYGTEIIKLIILNSKVTAPINITKELIENMQIIQDKYKKFVFKFYSKKIKFIEINTNKNEKYYKLVNSLVNYEFSNFNFLLNEYLKMFNKNNDEEIANVIFKILSVIHPKITLKKEYKFFLDVFDKWNYLISKKDYSKADKLRAVLIENKLI
ncbi:Cysteinyl-tRNA synthetase [Mycoplasmopsis meleagridis]|uniref:Cysteinyl-tRNA synthetase n=1 Tax=Mycoplasmopsis meleagridis ATCC 25294 TaxID=1264554 RepID=A0A0F5H0F1_9BACT|nr:class I tRNA ligase family protein [Mycoplasmopsis meleagridis]KKB26678.1 Cysteinyl-tRNA synthetase [Mycoplasmopsis meleagridis ATCC 25294]OAD18207.1 Cysteinyl-tRNA synthetase [Mycoplasmopsis meleagridis]VEU77733.1 Cysteine--tRNA ligase [Mycoplasmopsis meleagridis]